MDEKRFLIRSACPLYVCRVCRTKTGWRHQGWCDMADKSEPGCAECRYFDADRSRCNHPAEERRRSADEKNHVTVRARSES